jgi:uncharacterized membrane protein YccC
MHRRILGALIGIAILLAIGFLSLPPLRDPADQVLLILIGSAIIVLSAVRIAQMYWYGQPPSGSSELANRIYCWMNDDPDAPKQK